MFLTIIAVILIISFLVGIHEFGHYYTARKFGMKVEEFAIGMGPAIFKYTSKKTGILYSIRCIPIGGFCKIKGEDGGNGEEGEKVRAESGEENSQPSTLNPQPTSLDSDSFGSKKIWQRAVVLLGGVTMNLLFAIILIYIGLVIGMPGIIGDGDLKNGAKVKNERIIINSIVYNSSAEKAGIKSGSDLIKVNDSEIKNVNTLNELLKNADNIKLTLKNPDGKEQIINDLKKEFNKDANKNIYGIGFYQVGIVSYGPIKAIPETFRTTGSFISDMFKGLGYMMSSIFSGKGIPDGLAGPIGITFITGDAIKQGLSYVIYIVAQISLNLAIINIIPFPALDGGRVLFLIFEKIKGGKLNEKFEMITNSVGFLLLIALIIAVTFKDVFSFIIK